MKIIKIAGFLLALVCSVQAFAGGFIEESDYEVFPYVVTISGGPAWTRSAESQTIYLDPDIYKAYIANTGTHSFALLKTPNGTTMLGTGELFLGYRGILNSIVEGQLGFAFAASSPITLKGDIWEDADPAFNNYYYSYRLRNSRVAVKGLLLYDIGFYDVFPFLGASAGLGFNSSTNFSIRPKIYQEVPAPYFTNHRSKSFNYTLSTGIQIALSSNWRGGIGYEFANWGASRLGLAPGQTVGIGGLKLGSVRSNELQLSISYLA